MTELLLWPRLVTGTGDLKTDAMTGRPEVRWQTRSPHGSPGKVGGGGRGEKWWQKVCQASVTDWHWGFGDAEKDT